MSRRVPLPGGRVFHLSPGVTVLMLALLPLLCGLGLWQLQRAEQKREALALLAERRQAPALTAAALDGEAEARLVRLEGRFDAAHTILIDNRSHQGQPGVEVVQPFLDEPSRRWLLVNRGWLPWPNRRQLPVIDTPPGPLRLTARVHRPGPGGPLSEPRGVGWPRRVRHLDPARSWALLGRSGVAYELRQQSGPGRLTPNWTRTTLQPAQHVGYALQWFAMAAGVFGLWLYLGLQRGSPREIPGPEGAPLESRR